MLEFTKLKERSDNTSADQKIVNNHHPLSNSSNNKSIKTFASKHAPTKSFNEPNISHKKILGSKNYTSSSSTQSNSTTNGKTCVTESSYKERTGISNLSFVEKAPEHKIFVHRIKSRDTKSGFGTPSIDLKNFNEKNTNKYKEAAPSPAKQNIIKNIFKSSIFEGVQPSKYSQSNSNNGENGVKNNLLKNKMQINPKKRN